MATLTVEKVCSKCKVLKPRSEYTPKGSYLMARCKICRAEDRKITYKINPALYKLTSKKYRKTHVSQLKIKDKKYRIENSSKLKIYLKEYRSDLYPWNKTFYVINNRCSSADRKYYFQKGIKVLITKEELKMLWFRDKAYLLQNPSIDRLDSNDDYTYNNCRYIELSENIRRAHSKQQEEVSVNS